LKSRGNFVKSALGMEAAPNETPRLVQNAVTI
jgi:hypothetical protein